MFYTTKSNLVQKRERWTKKDGSSVGWWGWKEKIEGLL